MQIPGVCPGGGGMVTGQIRSVPWIYQGCVSLLKSKSVFLIQKRVVRRIQMIHTGYFEYISLFDMISPICNGLRAKFPHRNIYFHGFN